MIDPHDEAPLPAASTDTSAHSPTHNEPPPAPETKVSPKPAPVIKPFEEWAAAKKTEAHWLNAARVVNHWAIGRQVTEEAFDAAVDAAQKVEMR